MKRAITIATIAISLIIYALLAFVPDPLVLLIFTVGGGLWIGLPILVGSMIASLITALARRSPKIPLLVAGSVVVLFALAGLAIPANAYIYKQAEIMAKAYPEKIIPLLEAYRQNYGRYPSKLEQLSNKPPLPRLLRTSYGYRSDGRTFSFSFPRPGGLIDTWYFSSDTREWELST